MMITKATLLGTIATLITVGIATSDILISDVPSCLEDTANCNAMDASYNPSCIVRLRDHIQAELQASLQYLAMGAHFNQDEVNRKGIAEFFFKSASEERHHAIGFLKYLMLRGEKNITVIGDITPEITYWPDALTAFQHALDLEKKITLRIQVLTQECNKIDDFHATDFLTTKFLDEQLEGMRELSGKIANLQTMVKRQPNLGEFLFDLDLQSE